MDDYRNEAPPPRSALPPLGAPSLGFQMKPRTPGLRLQKAADAFMAEARIAITEAEAFKPCGTDAAMGLAEMARTHRIIQGLSLQEVADRADCTKSHVWEIENGRSRNPTVKMIAGLAGALGLPFMMLAGAALRDVTEAARQAQARARSAEGGGNG
jgi:helix-turn-helix protein